VFDVRKPFVLNGECSLYCTNVVFKFNRLHFVHKGLWRI